MTTGTPAGWYPNPDGSVGSQRYWDGAAWTEATRTWAPPPPGVPPSPGPGAPPLASYGRRLGAWLLDLLLVGAVSTPVLWLTNAVQHSRTIAYAGGTVRETGLWIGSRGLFIEGVIVIVYGATLCGSPGGQTLGMRWLELRVVDATSGGPLGYPRAFGRAALEYLLAVVLFLPWALDMLFPLWDRRRQTLHDKAVGAVVIDVTALRGADRLPDE